MDIVKAYLTRVPPTPRSAGMLLLGSYGVSVSRLFYRCEATRTGHPRRQGRTIPFPASSIRPDNEAATVVRPGIRRLEGHHARTQKDFIHPQEALPPQQRPHLLPAFSYAWPRWGQCQQASRRETHRALLMWVFNAVVGQGCCQMVPMEASSESPFDATDQHVSSPRQATFRQAIRQVHDLIDGEA